MVRRKAWSLQDLVGAYSSKVAHLHHQDKREREEQGQEKAREQERGQEQGR